jgi:hypothetical protein
MYVNVKSPISPTVYCLLDANLLAGYYAPQTLDDKEAANRIRNIIDSVRNGCSPHIKLLVPEICVAEAQTVLSKHANPKWKGTKKRDDPRSIHGKSYKSMESSMREHLHGGKVIESLPLQRYHVLMKHLITPIDHDIRKLGKGRKNVTRAMGGTDQLICGMAIWLCRLLGQGRLWVLTGDYRMAWVMNKAHKITDKKAMRLGIKQRAEQDIGFAFSKTIYPRAIYLSRAKVNELRECFGAWPLPTRKRKQLAHPRSPRAQEIEELVQLYKNMGIGRDRLPYTKHITHLTRQFCGRTGLKLDEGEVWSHLVARLKRPGGTMRRKRA